MSRHAPSERWSREHGGRAAYRRLGHYPGKVAHALYCEAMRLSREVGRGRVTYSCRWGSDYRLGEVAERHRHLGRRRSGTAT